MVWNEMLKQEVPEYWTVSTIGKLASLNKSALSKKEKLDELIYLDTSSLTENKINTLQRLKREDAPSRAQRKVKKNTILYSTVRPRLKHYGIICNPPETLIASTGFCTIDANSLKYSFWLYLFLTEEKITNKLGDIADTAVSSYPSIGPSDIEGLQVCFGDDGLMNAFHEKIAPLFEIMESNQNENKALQEQREELLPLLMNGQVSVTPPEVNCDLSCHLHLSLIVVTLRFWRFRKFLLNLRSRISPRFLSCRNWISLMKNPFREIMKILMQAAK